MNTVKIRGLEVSASHGVNDYEKKQLHPFVFDADLETDFYKGAMDDDLAGTVNYSSVCKLITKIAQENIFNLIEKLAYECAYCLLETFPAIKRITLTVWKPEAPMKCKFEKVGVTVGVEREIAYLSLGSSMGDKKAYLDKAVKLLSKERGIEVLKVSDYLETQPYGGVAKNTFLNCAVSVSTFLTPHGLLDIIHKIESECERERNIHWADRTLDIDIIFFGNKKICDETLTIPHPDYSNRDFVKIPLKAIAPHLIK